MIVTHGNSLAFAPFIVFALLDRLVGPLWGLIAGGIVAIGLIFRDRFLANGSPKILEIGTALLFCGLALLSRYRKSRMDHCCREAAGRCRPLLIVLVSIAIRRPFTL